MKKYEVVEDNDSQLLLVCLERLPTDNDPKKHTLLFLRLEYTDEWGSDIDFKYHGSICAVNPSMVTEENWKQTLDSFGMNPDEAPTDDVGKSQMLLDYGTFAPIFQTTGNSKAKVMKVLKEELPKVMMLGGSYLDRPVNAIGSTGWDFMRGEILAGLNKGG